MNKDSQFEPDYTHWLRMEAWRLDQAVSLLLNFEPEKCGLCRETDKKLDNNFREILAVARTSENESLIVIKRTFVSKLRVDLAIVKPSIFVQWAHSKGYEIPEHLLHLLGDKEEKQATRELTNNDDNLPQIQTIKSDSRIDQRVQDIARIATIWFIDPMNIPDGGKTRLRDTLCDQNLDLFTSTSTFDKAWQKAIKANLVTKLCNLFNYMVGALFWCHAAGLKAV